MTSLLDDLDRFGGALSHGELERLQTYLRNVFRGDEPFSETECATLGRIAALLVPAQRSALEKSLLHAFADLMDQWDARLRAGRSPAEMPVPPLLLDFAEQAFAWRSQGPGWHTGVDMGAVQWALGRIYDEHPEPMVTSRPRPKQKKRTSGRGRPGAEDPDPKAAENRKAAEPAKPKPERAQVAPFYQRVPALLQVFTPFLFLLLGEDRIYAGEKGWAAGLIVLFLFLCFLDYRLFYQRGASFQVARSWAVLSGLVSIPGYLFILFLVGAYLIRPTTQPVHEDSQHAVLNGAKPHPALCFAERRRAGVHVLETDAIRSTKLVQEIVKAAEIYQTHASVKDMDAAMALAPQKMARFVALPGNVDARRLFEGVLLGAEGRGADAQGTYIMRSGQRVRVPVAGDAKIRGYRRLVLLQLDGDGSDYAIAARCHGYTTREIFSPGKAGRVLQFCNPQARLIVEMRPFLDKGEKWTPPLMPAEPDAEICGTG